MEQYFEYRHVVSFEETNLVGNVYYSHYLRWQGRCREMFLRRFAPDVLADLRDDLKLFTLRVSCEFFAEITAFDELAIRMRLLELTHSQVEFGFDYVRLSDVRLSDAQPDAAGDGMLVARGSQRVACMRGPNQRTAPARVPESLVRALERYAPLGRPS